jgi:hypothetical protein
MPSAATKNAANDAKKSGRPGLKACRIRSTANGVSEKAPIHWARRRTFEVASMTSSTASSAMNASSSRPAAT